VRKEGVEERRKGKRGSKTLEVGRGSTGNPEKKWVE
jgi:hypothetical protein